MLLEQLLTLKTVSSAGKLLCCVPVKTRGARRQSSYQHTIGRVLYMLARMTHASVHGFARSQSHMQHTAKARSNSHGCSAGLQHSIASLGLSAA